MKPYVVLLAAIGTISSVLALAQTTAAPAAAPAGIQARLTKKLIQSLDLSATQKQQAKSILQSTRSQVQPLTSQIKQNRESLSAAIQTGDTAQIQQLATSLGTLQGQVLALRSTGMAQFYALLTPDQKTKAADFQQKAKQVLGAKGN